MGIFISFRSERLLDDVFSRRRHLALVLRSVRRRRPPMRTRAHVRVPRSEPQIEIRVVGILDADPELLMRRVLLDDKRIRRALMVFAVLCQSCASRSAFDRSWSSREYRHATARSWAVTVAGN
jgi:hypothetical protein